MALVMTFTPNGMDTTKYNEAIKQLEAAGAGMPPGRLYHVAFSSGGVFKVIGVWESQEAFNTFGQTLVPILQKLGVDPGQPEIAEVQNIIKG